MVAVSVIIPCYNQGLYVEEAVSSVLAQSFQDFEIIVVNDGSTDPQTNALLDNYRTRKTQVIRTENQGLAAARNNGIAVAKGRYILPLDADDKIDPEYLRRGVTILEENPEVGIVYSDARLFGAVETSWTLPDYSIERMLIDNIIFCSALFRKRDWQLVGGYDQGMVYGWEDYEFWLSLIERGRKVVKLSGELFYYRVASDSMVRSKEKWQKVEMFARIFRRHQELFARHIEVWLDPIVDSREMYHTSRLYVEQGQGLSDTSSVARKVDQGTRRIVFDLAGFGNIARLRFDPVDTFAVILLERIVLRYRSGEVKQLPKVSSNAHYVVDRTMYFGDSDPQCFFPEIGKNELRDLLEVEVHLQFQAIGEAALVMLVKYQEQILASRKLYFGLLRRTAKSGDDRGEVLLSDKN